MDRRSLSGSLDVTAGSGIWESEGGATFKTMKELVQLKTDLIIASAMMVSRKLSQ